MYQGQLHWEELRSHRECSDILGESPKWCNHPVLSEMYSKKEDLNLQSWAGALRYLIGSAGGI